MQTRRATPDDFEALRTVELASFETLRQAGAVSGAASASSDDELRQYLDHGLLVVGCDPDGAAIGFCGGHVADNLLHVGEMDVHPDWQRKGLGRRLLAAMLDEGRTRKLDGATLTTDRLAPFNAPFYSSMGFRLLEPGELSPRLRQILETEAEKGLDPLRRVAMMLRY